MNTSNLTHFGNLSYTARRAVGHDLKGSVSVYWKIGTKEAEKVCAGMGIPFAMNVNRETSVDERYLPMLRELENDGRIVIRVRR